MKSYHAHQQCFIINMKVEAFIFQTTLKVNPIAVLPTGRADEQLHALCPFSMVQGNYNKAIFIFP